MGKVGVLDVNVWDDPTRELTTTKFPFWSAIITQVQGSTSVAAGTTVYVDIQPPSGETWLCFFDGAVYGPYVGIRYDDYDGSSRRAHTRKQLLSTNDDDDDVFLPGLVKVLTNTLYASLEFSNPDSTPHTAVYGYSGFKLSQPLWRPERLSGLQTPPFKRSLDGRMVVFPALKDKAYVNPDDEIAYHLYSEDLARCPHTGHIVERAEHHVLEKDLVANIDTFKNDPDGTGWRKIFDKLAEEGISL